ncbi:MAG: SUMF1/EgtB/PvdO family nonheme iron enzyme [Proteobacteria bacterium]|nr:SUMF1/EgtB/PvdO family nonheme iron enzyme [Pseudomonadota bacterium]
MGQFLQELQRRKVLRVVVAYVVSSWVLLQVADLLGSILELPHWSSKLVFLILIIGFVPAIIIAWAYDLTPDGIKATTRLDGNTAPIYKTPVLFISVVVVVGIAAGGWWYSGSDVRWARDVAMTEIESLVESGELEAAYTIARNVGEIIPGDPEMQQIWDTFTWTTSIPSTPVGATVYRREYTSPESAWQAIGVTPLYDIQIPFGMSLLKIELEGYNPLLRAIGGGLRGHQELSVQKDPEAGFANVHPGSFTLDEVGAIPEGMLRVPGWDALIDGELIEFRDFFMGRYEVTNREYQSFVDAGAYKRHDLWEHDFVRDGQSITFAEAIALFVDKTGRAGPSTWEAGTYRDGEEDYPVAGISWYEAAAFARFSKRELPTIHHWRRAFAMGMLAWQLPASNLDRDAISAVGEYPGIGWTGTFDMAGNVREWCQNLAGDDQRVIVGGAFNDALYVVEEGISIADRRDAMDRSRTNGFRLVSTNEETTAMVAAAKPVVDAEIPRLADPVSDEVFAARLSDFDYDPGPLHAVVEKTTEYRHWTRQRITLDSPLSGERLTVYLYLPEREASRYQTILFWPGSSPLYLDSIDQVGMALDFALRNGRAVAYPIMKGMFERRVTPAPDWRTHSGRNLAIEEVREFRRMIDYLETRPDIETDSFSYYGYSWGGRMGAIVLAVEPRIKVGILNQAGINALDHADINVVHYLPHVQVPVLQFSGLYDTDFRYESSSKPFFDRLGTDAADKKHVVEPTGHFVPARIVKGETLGWLDKYLGVVD